MPAERPEDVPPERWAAMQAQAAREGREPTPEEIGPDRPDVDTLTRDQLVGRAKELGITYGLLTGDALRARVKEADRLVAEGKPLPASWQRRKPEKKMLLKDVIAEYAERRGLDPEQLTAAIDEVFPGMKAERDLYRKTKQDAHKTTNRNALQIRNIQNKGGGGDQGAISEVMAMETVKQNREHFGGGREEDDASAESARDYAQEVWDMLTEKQKPPLTKTSPEVLEAAEAEVLSVAKSKFDPVEYQKQLEKLPPESRAAKAWQDFTTDLRITADRIHGTFSTGGPLQYLPDAVRLTKEFVLAGILTFEEFVSAIYDAVGSVVFNKMHPALVEAWNTEREQRPEMNHAPPVIEPVPVPLYGEKAPKEKSFMREPVAPEPPPPREPEPSPAVKQGKMFRERKGDRPGQRDIIEEAEQRGEEIPEAGRGAAPQRPPPAPPAPAAPPPPPGGEHRPYSITNAAMAELTGQPEPETRGRTSHEELKAYAAAASHADIAALIERMRANPDDAVSKWDNALLARHVAEVGGQLTEAVRGKNTARASQLEDYLVELQELSKRSGTPEAQALESRKLLVDETDFSLPNQLSLLREAKGEKGPLTPEERATVVAGTDKLDKLAERNKEIEKEKAVEQAAPALEKIIGETKLPADFDPNAHTLGKRIIDWARNDRAEAAAAIKARHAGKFYSIGEIDPRDLRDLARIGSSFLLEGAATLGEWTKKMVEYVGDWIDKGGHIGTIWEASKAAEMDVIRKAAGKSPEKKPAIKKAVAERAKKVAEGDTIEGVTEKIGKRFNKDGTITSEMAGKLAKMIVEGGTRGREKVLAELHGILQSVRPDITLRETADLLSRYGQVTIPSQEEAAVELRDIKRQLQLTSALEDIEKGEAPKRTGFQRGEQSDTVRELERELNEAKREGGYTVTDSERQLRTPAQGEERALDNRIADLEAELQSGKTIGLKQKPEKIPRPELEAKLARWNALKARREEMRKLDPKYQADLKERDNAIYTRKLLERYADLKERVANEDFAPREVVPRKLTKEQAEIAYQSEQERNKLRAGRERLERANRSPVMKVLGGIRDTAHLYRIWKTALDYSGFLYQVGLTVAGRPILAAKALPEMFASGWSKKADFAATERLHNRPNFHLYGRDKLAIMDASGPLSGQEELFISRLVHKIPGVAGAGRAFTGLLNRVRADLYDLHAAALAPEGGLNPVEGKATANWANVWTGRGSLGRLEPAAVVLADIFFSPRQFVSRIQVILGQPLWHGTARTRKLIAKEYAKTLIGFGVVYGMVGLYKKLLGLDDRDVEIGTTPLDSELGKFRIGKTVIDPLAGMSQQTVFTARMSEAAYNGMKSLLGGEVSKEGRKRMRASPGTVGRFLQYKLAPWWQLAGDVMTGENFERDPTTPKSLATEVAVPLSLNDVYESMREQGVPGGTALSILAIFGLRIQTYEKKEAGKPSRRPLTRRALP